MADDIDVYLGKRLRWRRRLLGLTQQELAEACGIRFQQIQKYECGANRMSASRLWQLAEALETPISYFFEGLNAANAGVETTSAVRPAPRVNGTNGVRVYGLGAPVIRPLPEAGKDAER